jgi:regulator of replication initiation timing
MIPTLSRRRSLVKLHRFLPALLILLALVVASCGESEEERRLNKLSEEQKVLVQTTGGQLQDIAQDVRKLATENERLRQSAENLRDQLRDNQRIVEDLQGKLDGITQGLAASDATFSREAQAIRETGESGGFLRILLIFIGVLLVLGLIYLLLRSRSDYDEEEDDFADFEDDEDLGFDDEEDFEDELEEEDRPLGETKPEDEEKK